MNWCTDLDMEPILAVWGGLYLDGEVVSEADLGYYVQDTLNELEFLMGNTSTHWGSIRAQLGHPEPWPIRYVEVGNEDNLNDGEGSYAQYRFKMFFDAITKTYPHILVISSTTAFTYRRSGQDYHQYTVSTSTAILKQRRGRFMVQDSRDVSATKFVRLAV